MGISSVPNLGDAFLTLAFLPLLLLRDGVSWALLQVTGDYSTWNDDGGAGEAYAGTRVMVPAERSWRRAEEEEWCCSVCLQGFEKGKEVSQIVACRHMYHRSCLRRWLSVDAGNSCPLCRSPLQ